MNKKEFAIVHWIGNTQVLITKEFDDLAAPEEFYAVAIRFVSNKLGGIAAIGLTYETAKKQQASFEKCRDAKFIEETIKQML